MHLVIFGATGNVGRRVALGALRRGHQVTGVVRDPAAAQPPDPGVRLVPGDATRAEDIARVARGADAVVSAISPRPNARGLPAPSLAANVRALIAGLRPGRGQPHPLCGGRRQPGGRPRPGPG